ncbi:MAG TPA: extracellular solute-binding protein [Acidimicrobiales bacterium]|nr:extracellular solute-binding protein [Acidimicrobiales bacterium]
MTRSRTIAATALAVTSLGGVLTGVTAAATTAVPAGAASLPACPVAALAKAKGPVDISFWESMNRTNGVTLTKLTDQFNSSQSKVHVTLVDQNSYTTTWAKYQAGLSNGQLPAVAQLQDIQLQGAIDTQSILPVQSCIKATHYKTSDFIPRALAYWKADGAQQAMPFAVSNPIVFYNKQAFTAAGLTPTKPPATLSQFMTDAAALKAHGSGVGLKLDPWHLETWLATANSLFVNNANGRKARATKAVFAGKNALKIFTDLDTLVTSGEAATNPYTGPDEFDNLLGIGSGKYAMTIDTSAALGTIATLLGNGQYPNVTLGVGTFPVLTTKIKGGVEPGGSGLYISNKVPAAQQAAAWQYITFLDSPASQATWAAGTGYIPIRKSSTKTPTVQKLWATQPGFKVAYQQLVNGATTPATAGAAIGPFTTVRKAVLTAEESMYQQGVKPAAALKTAQKQIDSILASYNQRLGVT